MKLNLQQPVTTVNGTVILYDDGKYGGRRRDGKIDSIVCTHSACDVSFYINIDFGSFFQQCFRMKLSPELTARFFVAVGRVVRRPVTDDFIDRTQLQWSEYDTVQLNKLLTHADVIGVWCSGENNEQLAGIEGPGGLLTLAGFKRAHGIACNSTVEEERLALEKTLAWAERRAAETRVALRCLDSRHVDWGNGTVV